MLSFSCYQKSAAAIREKIGDFQPQVLLILGSGLGFLGDEVENPVIIDYEKIPHFKVSTAPDHQGRLVLGKLSGVDVMVMQGRMHYYEGYTPEEVSYPVRVAKLLGVHTMIVTNAAGAINTNYQVGDVMLIEDHIRIMGESPLRGENLPQFGLRFCDMTETYDPDLRAMALEKATALGLRVQQGVYFYFPGPQFETPAEIRMARAMGGDAAGMSTVYEATVANHCGIRTLGISLMTNMAAGILKQKLSGEEVNEAAARARDSFSTLVRSCLPELVK
ncbi:MAG: purine-nucleoside phosphorylase [Clostridia bacterium]|nr:purine-nucleoside phosphorylase [Clostridia bacterium]